MSGFAWVTLATNDSYSLGALVLAHSLKHTNTPHKMVVLITPSVSQTMRNQLQTVFDLVKSVEVLDSKDEAHLALLNRPELGVTFTKLHCWKLTEFEKCVFLDADTLVVKNCDDLFEREELSAAPDFGWPDCFNSGVFVFKPSEETFEKILQFAIQKGSYDGGDQGLLNQFFRDWSKDINKHLPFVYNLAAIAAYSYYPAFKQFGSETRIVHFIGTEKPWLQKLNPATKTISPVPGASCLTPLFQKWWDIFCEKVHPTLDKNLEAFNGMPQPPIVEACVNSVVVESNSEPQKPFLKEPCTPYRENDDFRQSNLPYRPFDVKTSFGSLLNLEFFAVLDPPSPAEGKKERKPFKEEKSLGSEPESYKYEKVSKIDIPEEKENEMEDKKPKEEPQAPKGPFDHEFFFPDEKCVNDYLLQNAMAYQPFDGCRSPSLLRGDEKKGKVDNLGTEETVLPLPRFLSIPEDDKRQSGNLISDICSGKKKKESLVLKSETKGTSEYRDKDGDKMSMHRGSVPPSTRECDPFHTQKCYPAASQNCDKLSLQRYETSLLQKNESSSAEKDETNTMKEIAKKKTELLIDVTKIGTTLKSSCWEFPTDLRAIKKFSMPKLKPILPKKNVSQKNAPTPFSKVTLYTELVLSSDYREPVDLPKDDVGFVESHILKIIAEKSRSEGKTKEKFGPLPVTTSVAKPKAPPEESQTPRRLSPELYDLKYCKRQQGNKPKPKQLKNKETKVFSTKSRKGVKPTGSRKMKSKNLLQKENVAEGTKAKTKDPRKSKMLPKESTTEDHKSKNDVEEILKKLKSFSKDYLHYFTEDNQNVKSFAPELHQNFLPSNIYEKYGKNQQHLDSRNIGA